MQLISLDNGHTCNACFWLQVVTDIIHLQNQKLSTYKGNYDTFERTRDENVKNQQKAFESSERSRAHMQVSFLFLLNDIDIIYSAFNSSMFSSLPA